MPPKKNKEIIRKVEEAWDQSRLDDLDKYFDPNFRSDAGIPGMEPTLATAKMAHQASMVSFPDRKVQIMDMLAEGDKVAVRLRVTGSNLGGVAWFGAPPNGNKIDIEAISIYTLKDGKIVGHQAVNDGAQLLAQIGAWTPPQMSG
jgi:ketosteroid isomerase-like protein